ncbi:MAG: UbiD family decarboxylase [Bacillota bacterium]
MSQDLREFLTKYESAFPDGVLRINNEIDSKYEPTALIKELDKHNRHPIVIFNNVKGSIIPVITNVLASRKSIAFSLGIKEEDLAIQYAKRVKDRISPKVLEGAPFNKNCLTNERIDLYNLPIFTHYPVDAGPYITGGLVIARDPDTGVSTCGYHRMQLKGKNKLGISLHSRKRLWDYYRRAEEAGKNLSAAVVFGVHPLISLGSMAVTPLDESKYDIIGGLMGEPMELANCTNIDVQVPYWSEIIIEGEIMAHEREKEGPFAEFTNYAAYRSTENVFIPKAVSYRNNCMFQSITGGMSAEHNNIMAVQREGDVLKSLNEGLPNIKKVNIPMSGCGFFHCYISMKKSAEGQPMQAILKALSVDHNLKLVIVVDEDVDVYDESSVLWAVATRVQADRDVLIIPQHQGMGCTLDPSSDELSRSSKMGIDATKTLNGFSGQSLYLPEEQVEKMKKLLKNLGY